MTDEARSSPKVNANDDLTVTSSRSNSHANILNSPSLRARSSSKMRKYKSKPHLKRISSGTGSHHKLIFSVDDDIGDDLSEEDFNFNNDDYNAKSKVDREYIEGYNDAIKALKKLKDKEGDAASTTVSTPVVTATGYFPDLNSHHRSTNEDIRPTLPFRKAKDRQNGAISSPGDDSPHTQLETLLSNTSVQSETAEPNIEGASEEVPADDDDDDDDGNSVLSSTSSETMESLNLKDRQNAINSTHPFGIKIWKPSLYKKNRSVAARADEDIHDYDPHKTLSKIFWGVRVTNFLWTITVGLALFLICSLGAICVFLLSGFAYHRHLRPYVKLLFKLGRYWLSPFGKFVLLNKDKNYLDEDELDGRSISEFERWRLQEEGRLFFAPPRRYTSSNGAGESKPLLKDHKGRPLRDAYSSLGESSRNTNIAFEQQSSPNNGSSAIDDADDLSNEYGEDPTDSTPDIKVRFFGRGSWSSGRLMFYVFFYGILQPILCIIGVFCWLFVFTIPMANITSTICDHLRRHPLALHFELEKIYYDKINNENTQKKYKNQSIILCTYRLCGFHYYKYTIDGTNIFFINLLAAVAYVIFDYYVLKEKLGWESWYTNSTFLFCACLFSIIPLAYFIGQAVASISAQSSMGVGAVINAFFSTIVEIFLYCVALNQAKGKLVEGSMIGSILGGVLLLPGLSMCGGALKRKTQRYNPRSAGVSSTMLLFAMVIMFAPSFFYQIYGPYEIKCRKCAFDSIDDDDDCVKCRFNQPSFTLDSLYYSIIKPFSLIVACALFLAYVCGLFFTLRTHASLIWATNSHEQALNAKKEDNYRRSPSVISFDAAPQQIIKSGNVPTKLLTLPPSAIDTKQASNIRVKPNSAVGSPSVEAGKHRILLKNELSRPSMASLTQKSDPNTPTKKEDPDDSAANGHDAPNWSRNKSTIILLGATLLYAIIAEILVNNVDAVLADFPINPKFLGLTVFALVPNTTEFLNAISFAIGGNVALSMEIGSAYALQVVLIQIPSLVVFSIYKGFDNVDKLFSLVFPRWDIIATLIAIYLFTYIYAEGKSNYFKGVILILSYVVLLVGFWLNDQIELMDDDYIGPPPPQVLANVAF